MTNTIRTIRRSPRYVTGAIEKTDVINKYKTREIIHLNGNFRSSRKQFQHWFQDLDSQKGSRVMSPLHQACQTLRRAILYY